MSCQLCHISDKDKIWQEGDFFGIEKCKTCGEPMIVHVFHVKELSFLDNKAALRLMKKYWPDREPRGIGMRSIKNHWHEHLIKK